MSTFAVLPIKRFERAKRRLEPAVSPGLRRELAAAMCADVLEALTRVAGLEALIVVTGEPAACAAAEAVGAEVVADEREQGQSAAALLGIARARRRGAERVLLVPGDCPTLDPRELEILLARGGAGPSVAIDPDRHGPGTNALLLTPPEVIVPAFGPGSCERHRESAQAAGAPARVERLPSLALDVDTAGDLATLRATLAPLPEVAPRTKRVLSGTGSATV